jgi:hypothetical protein
MRTHAIPCKSCSAPLGGPSDGASGLNAICPRLAQRARARLGTDGDGEQGATSRTSAATDAAELPLHKTGRPRRRAGISAAMRDGELAHLQPAVVTSPNSPLADGLHRERKMKVGCGGTWPGEAEQELTAAQSTREGEELRDARSSAAASETV